MARLPRLVLPGQAHLVVQRGQGVRPVFVDDVDRRTYVDALHAAAAAESIAVHAFALGEDEVMLLVTPPDRRSLSRFVQTLGRRYVSAYNRRHHQRGTLWDGRFRCGVVEAGAPRLAALRLVDGAGGMTSASHRSGGERHLLLTEIPEYWTLGNTPFDREAAYRTLLVQGLTGHEAAALRGAALGGWALGSPAFVREAAAGTSRPLQPRPRGRPRKA